MPLGAGFAQAFILMVGIGQLPDAGPAVEQDAPHLPRRQANQHIVALPRQHLRAGAGSPHQLSSSTWRQFEVVNHRASGDIPQRQGVSGADFGIRAGLHLVAYRKVHRRQDIGFFAVGVVQQRDTGGAVRVVFNGLYGSRHAVLAPLEVNSPVHPPRTAAAMVGGDASLVVAAAPLGQGFQQRLFRLPGGYFRERRPHRVAGAGSDGAYVFQWHNISIHPCKNHRPSIRSMRSPAASVTTAFLVSGCFLNRGP